MCLLNKEIVCWFAVIVDFPFCSASTPFAMGLSSADLREIKSTIINTFNEKFLQDIVDKVASAVEKKIEQRFDAQKEEIAALRSITEKLQKDSTDLRKSLETQEQAVRNMNIRIQGMKVENGENIRSKVLNLFTSKLKINIQNSDIKKCHRVPDKNPGDKPPAVLVRFTSDTARLSVLKNKKNLKNSGMSIKEDLTKVRLLLLNCAIRAFSFKNAWVLNGNIYIKYNNSVHRISDEADIEKIKT